jgi:two-component system, LytTR family, response regulator
MSTSRAIRVLIVDDEALARRGVRARLAAAAGFEATGEAATGQEAVRAIAELSPDLVFLDVQMPGLDGFGVVAAVGAERMPVTVFVTAHDQHALRAFEAHALDYLLKPLDDERFTRVLERARRRIEERRGDELGRKLAAVLAETGVAGSGTTAPGEAVSRSGAAGGRTLDRFLIKGGGRAQVLPAEEVDWIEAAGDYVRLHAGSRTHLLRDRISILAEQLDPSLFVRIHRSTIVNIERIRELQPYGNGDYSVVLTDGTSLKLSRGYRDQLEGVFGRGL